MAGASEKKRAEAEKFYGQLYTWVLVLVNVRDVRFPSKSSYDPISYNKTALGNAFPLASSSTSVYGLFG
jgi:hypothetical protein